MELQTLANLAEVVGIFIVAGGFIFAGLQIHHYRRQRSDLAAIELSRAWQEPSFAKAMRLVLDLPAGISAEDLGKRGPEYVGAAMQVSMGLETIGLMVHRRVLPLDIVFELMGGMTLTAWERLEPWTREFRIEQDNEKFSEWIEWLAHQLIAMRAATTPAHLRSMDWKP